MVFAKRRLGERCDQRRLPKMDCRAVLVKSRGGLVGILRAPFLTLFAKSRRREGKRTCHMRITIFGATGLLGKALMSEWTDDDVTGFGSADGDIRDEKQVLSLVQRSRPDWIILAAAYTDVDGCETHRELAFDVNCLGAANVAQAAKQQGCCLLFLSTDYVFDGTKTTPYATGDPRTTRSVYGQSKADAEVQ